MSKQTKMKALELNFGEFIKIINTRSWNAISKTRTSKIKKENSKWNVAFPYLISTENFSNCIGEQLGSFVGTSKHKGLTGDCNSSEYTY